MEPLCVLHNEVFFKYDIVYAIKISLIFMVYSMLHLHHKHCKTRIHCKQYIATIMKNDLMNLVLCISMSLNCSFFHAQLGGINFKSNKAKLFVVAEKNFYNEIP